MYYLCLVTAVQNTKHNKLSKKIFSNVTWTMEVFLGPYTIILHSKHLLLHFNEMRLFSGCRELRRVLPGKHCSVSISAVKQYYELYCIPVLKGEITGTITCQFLVSGCQKQRQCPSNLRFIAVKGRWSVFA